MKAVLLAILLFAIGSLIYVVSLFRGAAKRGGAVRLSALLAHTVLNPIYWVVFAVVLFAGWKLAAIWR